VNRTGGLPLARPRDLTAIFADALGVLFRHLGTFLALSAVVVVPVQLIVSGVGLEQLTAGYDDSPSVVELVIPAAVNFLVVTPLISAICIHALHSVAAGRSPGARGAIVEGFEAFAPIFFAIVLAAIGIVLGLLLVVPGVYLFIRWYVVPQAVVIEGARGPAALVRSGELTRGRWWRTFGIFALAYLATLIPGLLLITPLAAVAESTDRAVWSLVGTIATETVTAPFLALVSTLLYYDLRARAQPARSGSGVDPG
jgi:hypothetical protein